MEMTEYTTLGVPESIPGKEKDIHRRYGLRITHFQRGNKGAPHTTIRPRQYRFFSLCHLFEGEGWFWMPGGEKETVAAGDAVLVTPNVVIDYGAYRNFWVEDFICFVGPVAEHLMEAGVLDTGVIRIGSTRRILPIIEQAMDPSDDAQIAANSMLQKLLVDLYLENRPTGLEGKEKAVSELRKSLSQHVEHWWTVEEMAVECGMSVNHMRTLFKQQTGMTPKAYIERLKMMQAAERLCSSTDSVSEIAAKYSYQDPYHFSRAFKRVMGLSPQKYRIAHR